MTQAVAKILEEAQQLSALERTELVERLGETIADEDCPAVAEAQLAELDRRIAQVEAGEVELIPGEEAMAQIRRLVASSVARKNGQ